MTVTMTKVDGITVTSDTKRLWPPLCQILKTRCYSPVWRSVSGHLRRIQGSSQTALGTLQIIVGLLNIGLGIILHVNYFYLLSVSDMFAPYWLGVLFMVFGTVCVLSEKYHSPWLVLINAITNLVGFVFAVTATVLYSLCIGTVNHHQLWSKAEVLMSLRGLIGVLIVLSVLQLCVTISASVLGFKALRISEIKMQDHLQCETPSEAPPVFPPRFIDSRCDTISGSVLGSKALTESEITMQDHRHRETPTEFLPPFRDSRPGYYIVTTYDWDGVGKVKVTTSKVPFNSCHG